MQAAAKAPQVNQVRPEAARASSIPSAAGGSEPPRTPLLASLSGGNELELIPQDTARRVPMEFRAQAPGRCQRQNIKKPTDPPPSWRPDIQIWVDEWVERVDAKSPFEAKDLHVLEVQIDWRLISNSGVDEGFIRPVIGAGGWPMLPGSGIKGLFRRACPPERLLRWCGSPCALGDLSPGILRFHGAWPTDASWTQGILDLAHPQQNWQIGFEGGNESHKANAIISLFRPTLNIAISSVDKIEQPEWAAIDATLRKALDLGLGGRTAAGYGSSGQLSGDVVFQCGLEGQGPASKVLLKTPDFPDGVPEFRPTMFRAAIRGMALRLFGGLTDERTARQVVGRLFGSLGGDGKPSIGLISTAYVNSETRIGSYGTGALRQSTYATKGQLQWRVSRQCRDGEDERLLADLLTCLHGITMSLGGFGKSWRRPDHQIFFSDYGKMPIGCHWEWREPDRLPAFIHVQSATDLGRLLDQSRMIAARWLQATRCPEGVSAPWREVIHPDKMLIWTRSALHIGDAEVIHWFHNPREGEPRRDPRDLRKSELAGGIKQVSRIWNRLLPLDAGSQEQANTPIGSANPMTRPGPATASLGAATARPGAAIARPDGAALARPSQARHNPVHRGEVWMNHSQGPFLESLVLFPEQRQSPAFIRVMEQGANADFQRLKW